MKVVGEFNKISEQLKSEIPKLKPGQVVTFQMLNGVVNPEPDPVERSKTPMLYGKAQIRTRDRIFDPYKNDYVDIGVVDRVEKDRDGTSNIIEKLFVPGMGQFQFGGKFDLRGGRIDDEELFEYLWICNENGKNEYRDKSVKALFQPINILEDSNATIKTANTLRDALNLAGDMDVSEAREIAASLNWPYITEEPILLAKISDFASKFPDQFLKTASNPKTKTKSEIKKAVDAGIIVYDQMQKTVSIGDELIATLTIKDGNDFLSSFADWLATSRNGIEVYENIKNQLAAKKEENSFIEPKKKMGRPAKEKEPV